MGHWRYEGESKSEGLGTLMAPRYSSLIPFFSALISADQRGLAFQDLPGFPGGHAQAPQPASGG